MPLSEPYYTYIHIYIYIKSITKKVLFLIINQGYFSLGRNPFAFSSEYMDRITEQRDVRTKAKGR
jgi:hypothetical protein